MASKQARQLRKRKKRDLDNKRRKLVDDRRRREYDRQRQYRLHCPQFRFDTADGDPDFVQLVKEAVATINFEDAAVFPEWHRELYQTLKRGGTRAMRDQLLTMKLVAAEAGQAVGSIPDLEFAFTLGQTVLSRIPECARDRYLPLNDFTVVPERQHILVIVRSLLKAKGSGGTIYYSRRKPTLEIDGVRKIVAFSKHAIDRICERIKPRWKTSYAALGDIFAFLDQCAYFERCDLHGGQLGFTFYDGCDKEFIQYSYVEDVLGEENLDPKAGKPYYRVGYCPAVVEGEFVKAKTFLFPGYTQTPECDRLYRSSLSPAEKQAIHQKVKTLNAYTLYGSQDMSVIKWFHDNGVPQVVQLRQEVFAPVKPRPQSADPQR